MRTRLLKRFEQLSIREQNIMLALSLVFAPIGQARLQELLRKSACVDVVTRNLVAKPLREKLERLELLHISAHGWMCHENISEYLIKRAVKQGDLFNKLAPVVLQDVTQYSYLVSKQHDIKHMRINLYQGNTDAFILNFQAFENRNPNDVIALLKRLFFKDFDAQWFAELSAVIKARVLKNYLSMQSSRLEDCTQPYFILKEYIGKLKEPPVEMVHLVVQQQLLRGELNNVEPLLRADDSVNGLKLMGMLRFLQNHNDEAIVLFNAALQRLKKQTRKRNVFLDGIGGQFFNLALLHSQTPENINTLKKQLKMSSKQAVKNDFQFTDKRLLDGIDVYQAKAKATDDDYFILVRATAACYDRLFHTLLLYWLDELALMLSVDKAFLDTLAEMCIKAERNGYHWYATVGANLLQRLEFKNAQCTLIAEQKHNAQFNAIIDLLPRVESWQRALDALTQINTPTVTFGQDAANQEQRMIWTMDMYDKQIYLFPKEQKRGKKGRWTKGRPIAIKRLYQDLADFDYLTEQDRRICAHIEVDYEQTYYSYRARETFELKTQAALAAVGHPHIYWDNADAYDEPVTIDSAEIQVLVTQQRQQLLIALSPAIHGDEQYVVERTASDGLLLYPVSAQHRSVADILGTDGLLVPKKAKQQVIDAITSIAATLTVQSDIGGQAENAQTVTADSRMHLHLQALGAGMQIEVFVQPFHDGGPVYKPGMGGATVLAEIDGTKLQTTRDIALEKHYLQQLETECPALYHASDAKWLLDDTEMALEAVLQLQALDDFAVLEWPKGKAVKISKETGLSQVHFSVRKERDWFSVEGEIKVSDDQVLEMQQLMRLLAASPGRFLKLADGQVIALTQELRQRLDDFSGLGAAHEDALRFHPLAAQTLDEITQGMDIKAGKQWKQQLKALSEMAELNPQLPSTFQGELREYQLQGFQWLVRLAHLGAGACLADDMGLGKTIQALALILARAANGPTLILAPTSVCMNWLEEAQHFAPTLNVNYFGKGNRQQLIDEAGPFDLLVCSYGLLQTEAEKLSEKVWHTIVADEAQAIKNAFTKRSKAAMALQGDFKLVTTGTPIENHLGELWNLFNFINSGLLGSLKQFNERYAQRIENNQDHATRQRLRKLLRPFILRRLKNDVLTELPARTEVTLHVELSSEEKTLYEALRRNAMQTMSASRELGDAPGQQHLKVLAEIMKLRRACCHPRLVMADSPIASAKLQAFAELVAELISNRHKALVFSQFVGHLTLIRELLDTQRIQYQYLDGSTSIAKRKKAINMFQAGIGDFFLISLKAGGSGLNLTAADYVIHMDPWWNPAVEDQASDRAHRMGQKRPVTIYRIVAKDSIEDKIVDLHKHKRDLANSLLEGGEVSGKMSVEDMLELIRDMDEAGG